MRLLLDKNEFRVNAPSTRRDLAFCIRAIHAVDNDLRAVRRHIRSDVNFHPLTRPGVQDVVMAFMGFQAASACQRWCPFGGNPLGNGHIQGAANGFAAH